MITQSSLQLEADGESIAFHGELDAAVAPELRERFKEIVSAPGGRMLIDLTA